ncbi:MAG: site-specific integrase [Nannocystaceae bacterium]
MKSPGARNQVLCKLRAILNTAASWHVIADEHVPKIRTEKTPAKPEPIVLTEEEASRLLSAAEAMGSEQAAIVLLLLHGGLRISEVAALRWEDVDLDGGLMTIRHNFSAGEEATPKGAKAKPVGLTPPLAEALRRLPRKLEFVLTRRYRGELTHQTAHSLTYRLQKIQERAGLRKTGAHLLRHSCLTILAQRGCDPWRLQAHARHARIQTTQRYVHLAADIAAREAAAFWERPKTSAQTRPKRPNRRVRGDLAKN